MNAKPWYQRREHGMERRLRVAVMGAGMAGLSTARELLREGHQVVIFEKANQLGGTWVYDPRVESDPLGLDPTREVVHSSLYHSLRVNLPRQLMGFLDYPFSVRENGDPRAFPGHQEVLRFLNDFARHFGLIDLIRFGHEVVRVERLMAHKSNWIVECLSQSESLVDTFQAVVICNGKHTEPRLANFSGMHVWPGVQIHSHNYRTPTQFKDKIVVIIGHEFSASDIMKEISGVAKEVHQASRAPNVKFRKLDCNDNAWQHSMIDCVHEDGKVIFQDGSSVYADAIIHCTGYKFHFPFLRTDDVVQVDDNRVGPLYKHVFPPSLAPWLSFVGLPYRAAVTLLIELQSKWVAKVLSGKVALPTEEEMTNSVQDFYQKMDETGCPKHYTHKLLQDEFEYEKWLIGEMGIPPIEDWREKMFYTLLNIMVNRIYGDEYRDAWDIDGWMQLVEGGSS